MYHVFLRDESHLTYTHPTVSVVVDNERQIWQDEDGTEVLVATFPTAQVQATVDCSCETESCEHVDAITAQLNPPIVEPAAVARAKFGRGKAA